MHVAEWWRSLREAPPSLTTTQRRIFALVAIVSAVSRWFAIAASPWDWDEMLFMLATRRYDVSLHHPHPPGFPLFIALADLLRAIGLSEFHALQTIVVAASIAIVPATFFLCRELRLPFATSISAAAILAFFPNVWLFGGTAQSDVPSMTLVIVAVALLLRGCRDRRAYLAGAAVLGIAVGFRPQNLLIGFAPALIASACRRWRQVAVATLIGAAIVGASYGVAAERTGWENYRDAVMAHQKYIREVDSFRSPIRPPLWKAFDYFFVRPYRALPVNVPVALFVTVSFVVSCVKRRAPLLVTLAAFGPFAFFAWLMLDHFSTSRFSIGFAPMIAIFAADGIALLARRATLAVTVGLLLVMAVWVRPALHVVRTTLSPPVQSANWIRTHVDRRAPLYVHGSMGPFADALVDGWNVRPVMAPPPLPGWYWCEGRPFGSGGAAFERSRGRLLGLTRDRYYDVSVVPLTEVVRFGSGWYDLEQDENGGPTWRWMAQRSSAELPAIDAPAHLGLVLFVPEAPANITVSVDGVVVARTHATAREVDIGADLPRAAGARTMVIETDHPVVPGHGDERTLGLRLNDVRWTAR